MKIKISYAPDEERDACAATKAMLRLFPAIRVHKSENNPTHTQLYMTTRRPANAVIEPKTVDL